METQALSAKEIRKRKMQQLKKGIKASITAKKNQQSKLHSTLLTHKQDRQQGISGDLSGQDSSKFDKQNKTPALFAQKYQLGKIIGIGRNGTVYKCTHKQKKIEYAVKKIKLQLQHIIYLKQNFYQVKKLKHSGIIKYKALYMEPNKRSCYLVMQLFAHHQLGKHSIRNESQLKNIISKLLDVVAYMHRKGICHRDIKPDNILYDSATGEIKVIDFGISKKYRIRKFKKEMMTSTGTQLYKAPEMILGAIYNQLIDEWAVGVTIYKLITGVTPFQSQYIYEVNEKIKAGEIDFDQQIWNKMGMAKDLVKSLLQPVKNRMTASDAMKHLWFNSSHKNLNSSSIRLSIKKSFSIQKQVESLTESYPPKNDPLLSSIKQQNQQYTRQSLTNNLGVTGLAWVYSQEQND